MCGVSTRRVEKLVESLGLRVSRSEVSRICALLDEQVEAFRTRPLEGRYLGGFNRWWQHLDERTLRWAGRLVG